MINHLTSLDIKILNHIQLQFPVCHQPFKTLSSDLGITENEILNRIKVLKEKGFIRRITPLFDTGKLGYVGTLMAMKVPEERIDEIAKIIDEYPEITHNYQRVSEYNMWFTLIVRSNEESEKIITQIKAKTKIDQILNLKRMNRFKIAAVFEVSKFPPPEFEEDEISQPQRILSLDELDKKILKELQESMPLISKPYEFISQKIGINETELFKKIRWYKKTGIIRRVRAVLDHYKVGMGENVMVVFKVEPGEIVKAAKIMSQYPQVTHCYERTISCDWPYNLFVMLHGRTKQECEEVISLLLQKTNITTYQKLYTKRELKKSTPRYFYD